MALRFKAGDKVRVVGNYPFLQLEGIPREGVVEEVNEAWTWPYRVRLGDEDFALGDGELEFTQRQPSVRQLPTGLLTVLHDLNGEMVGPNEFTDEGWFSWRVRYEGGDIVLDLRHTPVPDVADQTERHESWILIPKG